MAWKKNGFSIFIWIIYLLAAAAGLFFVTASAAEALGWESPYALPVAGAAGLALAAVLFVLLRLLATCGWVKRLHAKYGKSSGRVPWNMVEGIAVVLLLAGALILRQLVLFMPDRFPALYGIVAAGENSEYFQAAKVTEGGSVPQVAHGIVYFYLQTLHFCFLLLGNRWEVGICIQIALQFIGAFLVCIGVRKLAGAFPAVLVLAYLLYFPSNVKAGFTYSPEMLYLCFFGLGLIVLASYFKLFSEGVPKGWRRILLPLAVGILTALLCYLDVCGISLIFLLLGAFLLERETAEDIWGKAVLQLPLLCLFLFGFFAGILALDAWSSHVGFLRVWNAWASLYQVKGWNPLFWMPERYLPGYVGVAALMVVGAISFWCRTSQREGLPWILAFLSLCGIGFWQIPAKRMDPAGLFWLVCVVLAANGLRDCLETEPEEMEEEEPEEEELEEGGLEEQEPERQESDQQERNESEWQETERNESERQKPERVEPKQGESAPQAGSQNNPVGGLQFIEDPFLRPRKVRKKPVGYILEPEESQMHYDVEVAEDDDFDY